MQRHVLKVRLRINQREELILSQRLQAIGKLRNALLGDLLNRLNKLRRDSRYQEALTQPKSRERSRALSELRYEHALTPNGARSLAHSHWKRSGWLSGVIDSRIALSLATETLKEVEAHWFQGVGRPRFKPATERQVAWGNDNKAGLRFKAESNEIIWPQPAYGKRKDLRIELPSRWRAGAPEYEKHLAGKRVVRVGLKREEVRGRTAWFALLCLEGVPYRSTDRAISSNDRFIGVDFGPSQIAIEAGDDSQIISLITVKELEVEKLIAKKRRRRQRALERSRRVMNPDSYDGRGRVIRGKRPKLRSKRARRLEARERAEARRAREHRKQRSQRVARHVVSLGKRIALEEIHYSTWQSSWFGKRMMLTTPGQLDQALQREAELAGGEVKRLSVKLALSQHCLCGARVKKELRERSHSCSRCGLGVDIPLDRDLFSALLARLCAEHPKQSLKLSEGPFNTAGYRREASRLTVTRPRLAPSLVINTEDSIDHAEARVTGLASEPVIQTPAQQSHASEFNSMSSTRSRRSRSGRRITIRAGDSSSLTSVSPTGASRGS